MKKIITLLIGVFVGVCVFITAAAAEDYSIPFVDMDKMEYECGEQMTIRIFNVKEVESGYCEIIRENTGDIIYRQDINPVEDKLIITAPYMNGEYVCKIYLNADTYLKPFRVKGEAERLVLSGNVFKNDTQKIIGVKLMIPEHKIGTNYKIIRTDRQGNEIIYDKIDANFFIDVNIEPNQTYRYVLYYGDIKSNELIIDIEEFNPSEHYDARKENSLTLTVGQSIMNNNGKNINIDSDSSIVPEIINSRTMLPIRAVVEAIGGTVEWDSNRQTVILSAYGNRVEIPVGLHTITVNGSGKSFDVPALIKNNRTLVPIRHMEELGCIVEWIGSEQCVVIKY